MSARTRGRRSPLLRTLFLILWMAGIALLLYTPLYMTLNANLNSEHLLALLLATSALLPTFGSSRFISIPKHNTKEYILSATIAILGHGALAFGLMAAYSLLFGVENLAQVILLSTGWIPAILISTIASVIENARTKRLASRGLHRVMSPIGNGRARTVSLLSGILFSVWLMASTGILLIIAYIDNGSVLAGIIFPLVWGCFAVFRPRAPRPKAYVLSAAITGTVLALLTHLLAVRHYMSGFTTYFDIVILNPLSSPAIPLSLATLAMSVILPLWTCKRGTEAAVSIH